MISRLLHTTAIRSTMLQSAMALMCSGAFAGIAQAADECGKTQQGTVLCASSGNPYSNGIEYTSAPIDPSQDPSLDPTTPVYDLTVNLGPDVAVERTSSGTGLALHGLNGGNVTAVSVGSIRTIGDYGIGVLAHADPGGSAGVTVHDVSTNGFGSQAVYAVGDAATVTVTGTVTTSYAFSTAVRATATNGVAQVTNNGTVVTYAGGGVGIVAYGSNGATVSGSGSVHTYGGGATGIAAAGFEGTTSVTATSVSTEGDFSRGVTAQGSGSVTIQVGNVVTSGNVADGIQGDTFQNDSGVLEADLNVTAANVITLGDASNGISLFSANNGMVRVEAGNVMTYGEGAAGIVTETYAADTVINVAYVATTGAGTETVFNRPTGIRATSDTGDITVFSSNAISTHGMYGMGVSATTAGDVTVHVNNVSTLGDAATAISAVGGNSSVMVDGLVSTFGAAAQGVYANGQAGTATVINNGMIDVTGLNSKGIVARATGDVTVSGEGAVRSASTALDIQSDVGNIIVHQVAIVSRGDHADGVSASTGGGVVVDVGSVRASGRAGTAIRTSAGEGADVRVAGAVVSDTGTGVSLSAGDIARLTVAAGGTVAGGTDAVVIDSRQGALVDNAGTIIAGTGYALRITGAPATITNTGTLDGRLRLTDGNDTLHNRGLLTLTGASDFGAGIDMLVNDGTIRLATADKAQAASVAGLEALANSGAIDLRNGVAGDRLTLADVSYVGRGDAMLGLDVAFADGAAIADHLFLQSAAGVTAISLKVMGAPTLFAPISLVDVDTATSPAAFKLAGATRDFGLISIGLVYATEASAFRLVSSPSTAVYRQAQLGEALTSLWNRSADAISARFSSNRDTAWSGEAMAGSGRLWLQTLGEINTRHERRDYNVTGLAQIDVDLGYRQDAFGAQIGLDVIGRGEGGGAIMGVTGGYLSSATRFSAGGGDRFDVDAINLGAYAGLRSGRFFVNGLAKYDFYIVDHRSAVVELDRKDDAHAWGGKIEAGARLGSASVFAEPMVSIAYSQTSLDDFAADRSRFDYDRFDGLRGKAGLRLGGSADVSGSAIAFYAAGAAIKEFEGEDGLRFTSGGQVVALGTNRLKAFGQGTVGVNVTMPSGVSGFIEAHGDIGQQYRGGGGRAGLRISL